MPVDSRLIDALAALDFPISGAVMPLLERLRGRDVCRASHRFMTDDIARDLWVQWNPAFTQTIEDRAFLAAFRRFLADGMELGFRLDRFREVSAGLPPPDRRARNWIPFFEEALAPEDCCRVRLYVSRDEYQTLQASNRGPDTSSWNTRLSMMADGLFWELGLIMPPPEVVVDSTLSPPWFRCQWNDFSLPQERGLERHTLLVNDTPERLRLLNIEGTAAVNPANGNECAIIPRTYGEAAKQAGLTVWTADEYLVLALSAAIRQAAAGLVNRTLCDLYLDRLREFTPEPVSLLDGSIEPDFVVQVVRGLLAEEISVREMSRILQSVLELRAVTAVDPGKYIVFSPNTGGTFPVVSPQPVSELVPADYVEFVRAGMKRYISHKYTRGQNTLIVYLLDPEAENRLVATDQLRVEDEAAILAAVKEEVGSSPDSQTTVILTTTGVRRKMRWLVAPEFPRLAVLSYSELSPDMNIQPIARISPDFDR